MTSNSPDTPLTVLRLRDLLHWTDGDHHYVLACDSNAGIGQRSNDALDQTPEDTGYSAAKVPLMEVLASGATPFALVNTLGGPRDDYGQRILAGIAAAISEVDARIELTGSDETNVSTYQTAVGVTVIGWASREALRFGGARIGDVVVSIGVPKDGRIVAYREGDGDIATVRDVQTIIRSPYVHEVLPVGSRGIRYESQQLAGGVNATIALTPDLTIDLDISAGASTCFLAAAPPDRIDELATLVRPPLTVIGRIDSLAS